jgi:putative hydrolase of HD superfamily
MALVHDMAEAITTDITPDSPISPEEKHQLETQAMEYIRAMLAGNAFAEEAIALWREYAADETPEAQFVKDLDKSELIYQVVEYEKA